MANHSAVVSVAIRAPLQILQVPTVKPSDEEVRVEVEWVASTPADLHFNDGGGPLVKHPRVLGDGFAGTVVEVGTGVEKLAVGDKVFGFTWREQKERAQQEFVTLPHYLLGKVPKNLTLQEVVTVPNNLVTVFHAITSAMGLPLPWPRPATPPKAASTPILIWGGSSSVGQYALQVFSYYGYTNLLTTSSATHHVHLKSLGGGNVQTFDYRSCEVINKILQATNGGEGLRVLDCIGSKYRTVEPISKIAGKNSVVAVLLPVIVKDPTEGDGGEPIYSSDPSKEAHWKEGVEVSGVATFSYLQNTMFKEKLQSEIMPTLLEMGAVIPNRYRIVEGNTMLERAQRAMDILRRREVSGERLIWKVAE